MKIRDGLTYDDLLLVPKYSTVKSRKNVDLSVDLGKGVKLGIPIISANMKKVTGFDMCFKLSQLGGLPIMHRFYDSIEDQVKAFVQVVEADCKYVGVSVGVGRTGEETFNALAEIGANIFCLDIAHADSLMAVNMVKYINKTAPQALLIAGNVATGSGAQRLADAGADVIKVNIGSGCFAAGTRILMSNGIYKNIEDVKENDYVINMDGKPVRVIKSFSTGIKKVSKLRNSIFYEDTYVTPNHQYFIGDLSTCKHAVNHKNISYVRLLEKQSKTVPKASKFKWQEIGKHQNLALLMPKEIAFDLPASFKIDLFRYVGGGRHGDKLKRLDCTLIPSYDLGYVFGTFLGDGNASCTFNTKRPSHSGQLHWYFGKNEMHIVNKLKECCNKLFKNTFYISENDSIFLCALNYKPLADFLNTFGKKKDKFLPDNLIVNDKQYLRGILDGLVDSDGHVEKEYIHKSVKSISEGRINLSNTSTKIIELFNVICYLINGYFPNNQKTKISTGNLQGANIDNFNQGYCARINITSQKRIGKHYQVSKLLEYIETAVEIPVYDLTVECNTHSFIANNAIVHNSICSTRIETGNGVPSLTALDDAYEQSMFGEKFKIIADGGLTSAGAITKALCFSHAVMLGNLLAGTDEAPGEIFSIDNVLYKTYSGSSTHKTSHVEGVVASVPYKGPVENIIIRLMEGLRSGCSYQGAHNLEELRKDPEFVSISNTGLIESRPHDVLLKS